MRSVRNRSPATTLLPFHASATAATELAAEWFHRLMPMVAEAMMNRTGIKIPMARS
jgi:hypothetical protein